MFFKVNQIKLYRFYAKYKQNLMIKYNMLIIFSPEFRTNMNILESVVGRKKEKTFKKFVDINNRRFDPSQPQLHQKHLTKLIVLIFIYKDNITSISCFFKHLIKLLFLVFIMLLISFFLSNISLSYYFYYYFKYFCYLSCIKSI